MGCSVSGEDWRLSWFFVPDTSSRDVTANLNDEVIHANVSAQGLYNSASPGYPLKAAESEKTSRDTHGALFLICGVILGVPLGVLAACGVREFLCAMYEKYRMEALRRHYLYRMRIPVTMPVRWRRRSPPCKVNDPEPRAEDMEEWT